MTDTATYNDTFNRNDISRVYASFAADYKIVAEWTKLHNPRFVDETTREIKALAEAQYMREVHLQLISANGDIREAAVYRVSTDASSWSSDRPGSLYWDTREGDGLHLIVYYSKKWTDLPEADRDAFAKLHMPGWGPSSFNGSYGSMTQSTDRRYASRAYGLERTRYSA